MDDIESKLELLFSHLIDQRVDSVYIEDDSFVMEFADGTYLQLYSDDGDLDMYFEIAQEPPALH
jgi:hypothetical protein